MIEQYKHETFIPWTPKASVFLLSLSLKESQIIFVSSGFVSLWNQFDVRVNFGTFSFDMPAGLNIIKL